MCQSLGMLSCLKIRPYDLAQSLSLSVSLYLLMIELPATQQGQPTVPAHKQHTSITSINRNSLTNCRTQSPAPPAVLPAELQTTPESVQLQDSWVLGSNVPLESR